MANPPVFMPNPADERVPGSTPLPPSFPTQPSSVQATPMPSVANGMSPQEVIAYYSALAATPQGQAAMRGQEQTAQMNIKIANAAMKNQAQQIAIQQGEAAANKWYQQQQVGIANRAHELAVQTQNQSNAIATGALTGTFGGEPTLAAKTQAQANAIQQGQLALNQLTQQQQHELSMGTLNLATLTQQQRNALDQAQLALNTAGVTGEINGRPTLAALAQQQANQIAQGNLGVNQANTSGYMPNGAPTLANTEFQTNSSGYMPGGQATLTREQAAASTALDAARLGASLQGPGNWAQFLQAQNAVAGSPASALVSSAPGGLGAAAGPNPPPMTLASVLGGFGVMPQQGAGTMQPGAGAGMPWQGAPGQQPGPASGWSNADPNTFNNGGGGQMYAGGTPGFNEQTGQYGADPVAGAQSPMRFADVMGAGGGPSFWNEGGGMGTDTGAGFWGNQGSGQPAMTTQAGMTHEQQVAQWNALTPEQQAQYDPATRAQFGTSWNPNSPTGALGQAANAPRVTNQQLGLSDQDASTLQGYMNNPNSAPGTFWASKSPDEKAYLGGLFKYWGGSPDTYQYRERNARPSQASVFAA